MTAINSNRAIRGPVTAVPVVAGKGVRLVADTENNRWIVEADETVLWEGAASTANITLSEAPINFEYIKVYIKRQSSLEGFTKALMFPVKTASVSFPLMLTYESIESATSYTTYITRYNGNTSNTSFTFAFAQKISSTVGGSVTHASDSGTIEIFKVVGVNRVASN